MILVDTSVWIDHLRSSNPALVGLLHGGAVLSHPWIVGEVALGNLRNRREVIESLRRLPSATVADDGEVLLLIEAEHLHGTGIGFVDAQLLAAARLTRDGLLWTRDKRLAAAAGKLGVAYAGA